MSGVDYGRINEAIRRMARQDGRDVLFEAEVAEVQDMTVSVEYLGVRLDGVRLSAGGSGSADTVVCRPRVGSMVLVADVSEGEKRDLVVLLEEETEEVIINGGELGGLVKIEELRKSLDSLKGFCEDLRDAVKQGLSAVGAGTAANGTLGAEAFDGAMAGKGIKIEDMEDVRVRH